MKHFILLLLILCLTWEDIQAKEFRSAKIRYIYDKASHHISDKKLLPKFEEELAVFDNLYMNTKDEYFHGKTIEQELEKVDEKLFKMLERYELQLASAAFKEKVKHVSLYQTVREPLDMSKTFNDKEIQKIWSKVVDSSFAEDYKIGLHDKLVILYEKLQKFEQAREDLNDEHHENSVHANKDVEEKRKTIDQDIINVRNEVKHLREEVNVELTNPYEDKHIRSLWRKAQLDGKLTLKDLEELKGHLEHFDQKFKKRAFIKKELESSPNDKKMYAEEEDLKAKYDELDRTFTKALAFLKQKYKHSEL